MADERAGTRESEFRNRYSWTSLLRTFLVALDPFKLLVAAFGILATAIGWWLLSVVFWASWDQSPQDDAAKNRLAFMRDYAGPADEPAGQRAGRLRSMPWAEDRGPNPYYLIKDVATGTPDDRRNMLERFSSSSAPNLIEPLRKFLSPIIGLFDPRGNFWTRLFLFLALLWLLLVWSFAGGVITRMAVLQLAGKEGGGLREAVRFVSNRYLSYLFSPLVPIGIILAVVLGCIIFGLFHLIPVIGDIFDGFFWWIPLGAGFVMALLLVGLVGYPLMYTTLSTEGSDTFDALSRSYNYVYESPWNYLWYAFVAILYGAVVVLFVVFMSSLMVYLGKWGVSQTPITQSANAEPEYLMIYAPKSFGWRQLLVEGSPVAINEDGTPKNKKAYDEYMESYKFQHYAAAGMVGFWLTAVFMLMLGFSYSYFWTAASMIYLLMRKKVDETEIDEIYIEDEEPEEPLAPSKLPPPPPPGQGAPQMVEPPSLRVTSTPPAVPEPPPPVPSPPPPPVPSPPASELTPPAPIPLETPKSGVTPSPESSSSTGSKSEPANGAIETTPKPSSSTPPPADADGDKS